MAHPATQWGSDAQTGTGAASAGGVQLPRNTDTRGRARRLTFDMNDFPMNSEAAAADEDGAPEADLTLEAFLQRVQDDPEEMFNYLSEQFDRILRNMTQRIDEKDEAILRLIGERDEYQSAFARLSLQRTAPADAAEPKPRRSAKLPDGLPLDNGKDPKYELWKANVQAKLRANADHYEDAEARMAYVLSMVRGEASSHLLTRMRNNATNRYRDVQDMFDHLDTIYLDVN